jgi:hypothetical protein
MSEHEHNAKPEPTPVDFDELFPGRFLKAGLFRVRPLTLRITAVDVEALPDDKGGERRRGIISFKQTDMQLVLNRTNGECLKAMFGARVQDWIGKRVTFACEQDRFGNELVDAIRIVGSPDLTKPVEVLIKMPHKKPRARKLAVTSASNTTPNQDDVPADVPEPIDDKDVPF